MLSAGWRSIWHISRYPWPVKLGSEPNFLCIQVPRIDSLAGNWDPTPNSLHLRFSATLASRRSSTATLLEAFNAYSKIASG